jgi:hypothetical protein
MEYWNIFAHELGAILASRNLRLGHLDDRLAIHRETVRRLMSRYISLLASLSSILKTWRLSSLSSN